ncbi:retrovirus-related pol polyprotein from transposon TNT 1-94, partial [Tanacetum coccineum]
SFQLTTATAGGQPKLVVQCTYTLPFPSEAAHSDEERNSVGILKHILMGQRIMKENCVYSLDGWAESGEARFGIQEKESFAQVWRKRLGHISEAGLHELERRDVLGNKGLVKLKLCENCVIGKSTREFNNLCKESGISRHMTVTGTPQQNGLAKRMNKTLLNKVRCLPIQFGLPDSFWVETTVTAAYLINRSPSSILDKKTPMDLWLGHPDTLKGAGAADSRKEVEYEVKLQGSRVEPTMDPYTGENPGNEDEEQDKGPQ